MRDLAVLFLHILATPSGSTSMPDLQKLSKLC